jgi:hypothetical protein
MTIAVNDWPGTSARAEAEVASAGGRAALYRDRGRLDPVPQCPLVPWFNSESPQYRECGNEASGRLAGRRALSSASVRMTELHIS